MPIRRYLKDQGRECGMIVWNLTYNPDIIIFTQEVEKGL